MSMIVEQIRDALPDLSLGQIASVVKNDWKKVNYAAAPYLDAMRCLNSVEDNYFADSGRSIVNYFLANAGSWRGEVAKMVKAELKARAK